MIDDQKKEIKRLQEECARERLRAESAINALLAKTAKIALAPEKTAEAEDREAGRFEKLLDDTFNMFAEDPTREELEADMMKRLQS